MMKQLKNNSDIPVVIFCGGVGSRMRELTLDRPKPMVEIGYKPILWHIMKIYKHYGFNTFILTLGYQGGYIRGYFEQEGGSLFKDFNVILAETGENTTTGGRLLKVAKYIKSPNFLCTYGDGVSDVDINELYNFHLKSQGVGTLTAVRVEHKLGVVEVDQNGKMLSYRKGHLTKEFMHGGFMVFDEKYLNYLKEDDEVEGPFNLLCKKGKMAVYKHQGFWGAVDTYKDLSVLNNLWSNGRPWKVWSD